MDSLSMSIKQIKRLLHLLRLLSPQLLPQLLILNQAVEKTQAARLPLSHQAVLALPALLHRVLPPRLMD